MQSQPNASHALPEQPTDADLGRALSRIKYEFAVVGVLERAPESALAFAKHLGWSSAWSRQRSALQHEDRLPWRRHQDVSPGLRQRILEKNQHDDVLYHSPTSYWTAMYEMYTVAASTNVEVRCL